MSAFIDLLAQSWVQWTADVWLRHIILIGCGVMLLVLLRNYEPRLRRSISIILGIALCIPPLLTIEAVAPSGATVSSLDAVVIAGSVKSAVGAAVGTYFAENILFTLWLIGAAVLSVLTVAGSCKHYRMALQSKGISGGLRPEGTPAKVWIGIHAQASIPYVVAWFGGPRIVVPAEWYNWSDQERAAVMAHELAHVTQRDHLWILLFSALRIVFWWNPFVWMLGRAYHHSSEMCSDDRARREVKLSATDYAQVLLNFASKSSPRLGMAVTFVQQPSLLKQRILHQIQPSKELFMRKLVLAAVCLAALPFFFATESAHSVGGLMAEEQTETQKMIENADKLAVIKGVQLRSEAYIKGGASSIAKVLHYPEACYEAGAEARIVLELVVQPDGQVTHISYLAKDSEMLNGKKDFELMRLFANAAMESVQQVNFEPAVAAGDGSKVRSKVLLPITYKMPTLKKADSKSAHPIDK